MKPYNQDPRLWPGAKANDANGSSHLQETPEFAGLSSPPAWRLEDSADFEAGADIALTNGEAYCNNKTGLVFMPDVFVARAIAEGAALPPTVRAERDDGRVCLVYWDPRIAA